MSIFDDMGRIIEQTKTGATSEADVHEAYERAAASVPQDTLADALSHAFRAEHTGPFPNMVAKLFAQSNPEQRAGALNTLLRQVNPAQRTAVLGAIPAANATQVTPEQALQVQPYQVERLAEHAQQRDPAIVDQASRFYAQHPHLVKTLGVAALGVVLSQMGSRR
jgi:hypothetical protein